MNKTLLFSFLGVLAVVFISSIVWINLQPDDAGEKISIDLYKSPTCGCCGLYVKYLEKNGFNVKVTDVNNVVPTKEQYGVPSNMQSCHTSLIQGKFIEGHIPVEAMKDYIARGMPGKGIAMPGMPAGSPGMPGRKTSPFVITQINEDGSQAEWTRI